MSRDDDLFEAAKAKRAQEKAEEDSRGNFVFEEIAYGELENDAYRVFRILGRPASVRKDPTDAKLIEQSMILGDDNKRFRCTWSPDQNWILRRLYNFLTDGTWVQPSPEVKSVKVYKYIERCPNLLNRVLFNNNLNNPYEKGIRPQKFALMNVISRNDMAYHEENNHTKIMSKRRSVADDGRVFYERGVPAFLYNEKIWDDVAGYEGNWENYDIVIFKTKDQPYYKAYYGGSDDLRKRLAIDSPDTLNLISTAPLTEWEKGLERYDLDKIGRVTSYARLFTKLGSFFRVVDQEFKTTYYDELVALKETEAKERAAQQEAETEEELKKEEKPVAHTKEAEPPVKEVEPKVEKEEVPIRRVRQSAAPAEEVGMTKELWSKLADGSYNGTVYKGVPFLTEDEKSQVLSVRKDGSFSYVPEWNGAKTILYKEQTSGSEFESPGTFSTCPLTGENFEQPE